MEVLIVFLLLIGLIVLVVYISKSKHTMPEKPRKQTLVEYPIFDAASEKGQMGEREVQEILSHLPRAEYVVLNDVLLPTENGTTQIDHVVVSLYGIFVIESKNYKGKIYGARESEKWSQYIGGKQFSFRNPLKQNLGHVIAVEKATGISSNNIIPLVVFTGSAELKLQGCEEVIYDWMLYDAICSYRSRVLTPERMEVCARIIDEKLEENFETKNAHIIGVRNRTACWDQEVKAGQCPRCDGFLVLRKGKYGDFYGCSNYPKCKFTKKL